VRQAILFIPYKNKGAISSQVLLLPLMEAILMSPLFPLAYLSTTKINKNSQNQKKSFRKPQTPSPHLGQKERKREERGKKRGVGRGRERRSQKNSKEKNGCQFYESE
jgi:hypothetical protein